MDVKKYKPLSTPHLFGTRDIKSQDRTDSAIVTAKKRVQSAKIALERTRELIEQSRELIDHARKHR